MEALVQACATALDIDGRLGARLLAVYRRGVRACRRCGDDDLRRRHHGPRQADLRALGCLDVSVATSCSVLQLNPRNRRSSCSLAHSAVVVQHVGVNNGATMCVAV